MMLDYSVLYYSILSYYSTVYYMIVYYKLVYCMCVISIVTIMCIGMNIIIVMISVSLSCFLDTYIYIYMFQGAEPPGNVSGHGFRNTVWLACKQFLAAGGKKQPETAATRSISKIRFVDPKIMGKSP